MKTEIATFCKEYEEVLTPLTGVLKESSECIERESRKEVLRMTLAGLNDAGLRLKTLTEKIEGQQAYLLIFGPLKSGKSTLINAISSTYVSEVTSLPAYPCLVYVSYGDTKTFTVTSYNGKEKVYPDNPALQEAVTLAHASLADRIRQKEHEGGTFDPGVDFPEAIRRIDIKLPINNLMESSTVMVDTPGLYSRMKFGYDLMTREFRDSAACAVFVVKTDNLYLEQVFAEFKDLLDLFSRIFLVVNIDGSKRDLRPDGTLQPSLESQNPKKIIEAFEMLAMNAQLKDALEDGRLRIYPIDLLNSAADYLKMADDEKNGVASVAEETDTTDSAEEGAHIATISGSGETEPPPPSFETFLIDLTDYLNSNEYFLGFMRDSLRQGKTLCQEIKKHCSPESLEEFERSQKDLVTQMASAEAKSQAALQLQKIDNVNIFQRIRKDAEQTAGEIAQNLKADVSASLEQALNKWYDSDDSLRDLIQNHYAPVLQEFTAKVDAETVTAVKQLVDTPFAGADFSSEAMKAINTLEFSLPEIGKSILQKIDPSKGFTNTTLAVDEANIPMRKTFLDWLLFRNQASIRRRIFGTPDDLSLPIPSDIKHRRLGQEGLQAVHRLSLEALDRHFQQLPKMSSDRTMGKYVKDFLRTLNERVDRTKTELAERLKQIQAQMKSDKVITDSLNTLRDRAGEIESGIEALIQSHECELEKIEELPAEREIPDETNDNEQVQWA